MRLSVWADVKLMPLAVGLLTEKYSPDAKLVSPEQEGKIKLEGKVKG